jgi:adenine-specific DNA-methyltransferase
MTNKKQKLELTWIGKDREVKLEPRILIENPDKSYGDPNSENMLIHGDNLLALKALEQNFTGRIKCIYIDPPYNTGNAFEHYDDNLEHSIWLNLIRPRLEILRKLLSKDGFLACHIDDSEGHYLKVLLDEVFGRNNYLTTIYIRVRYAEKTLKQDMDFHKEIEQIHVYRKEYGAKPNLNKSEISFDKFNFSIEELSKGQEIEIGNKKVIMFKKGEYKINKGKDGGEYGLKEIWASGTILDGNSSGRYFRDYLTGRYSSDGYGVLYKVFGIGDDRYDHRYFTGPNKVGATKGKYYQGIPMDKLENKELGKLSPINNFYDLAADFGNCRTEGGVDFRGGKKPEKLIQIILNHFSNKNDWVLDSFLGSGSTIASAHKMNRKWIGIEIGEQANTHSLPRLKSIVNGTDNTGISKSEKWLGGGGFKFYNLAPSLLRKDSFGNFVIDEQYNVNMLAAAMCKHEGFKYSPDETIYWKQGRSTETDYIFVTTGFVTKEQLDSVHAQMTENESLLICAKSFALGCDSHYSNITIKKIPQMILGKCEFAKDNYDLNIVKETVEEVEESYEAQDE